MNEKLKALRADLETKNARLEELCKAAEPTEEQVTEIKGLDEACEGIVKQIEEIGRQQELEKRVAERKAFLSQPATQVPPAEPTEGVGDAEALPAEVKIHARYNTVTNFSGTAQERALKAYTMGAWWLAIRGHAKSREWCRKNGIEIKAMAGDDNTAGGFLVPAVLAPDIIDLQKDYGVTRNLLRVRRMTGDTLNVTRATSDITGYWIGENTTITNSDRAFDQVALSAKTLGALTYYSVQLAEDAIIDVGADLARNFANVFAKMEDQACFLGDGTSTYGKILGVIETMKKTVTDAGGTWTTDAHKIYNPSIIVAAGNAFSEVTLANLNSVRGGVQKFKQAGSNVWMCNSAFYYAVAERLMSAAGGATAGEIANFNSEPPRLLGRPVVFVEVMIEQEANSGVPLLYGDLSLAGTLGDRRELTVATSEHAAFAAGQLAVRAMERLDIAIHDVGTASSTAASRVRGPVGMLALANS